MKVPGYALCKSCPVIFSFPFAHPEKHTHSTTNGMLIGLPVHSYLTLPCSLEQGQRFSLRLIFRTKWNNCGMLSFEMSQACGIVSLALNADPVLVEEKLTQAVLHSCNITTFFSERLLSLKNSIGSPTGRWESSAVFTKALCERAMCVRGQFCIDWFEYVTWEAIKDDFYKIVLKHKPFRIRTDLTDIRSLLYTCMLHRHLCVWCTIKLQQIYSAPERGFPGQR